MSTASVFPRVLEQEVAERSSCRACLEFIGTSGARLSAAVLKTRQRDPCTRECCVEDNTARVDTQHGMGCMLW
jgi:hypothetical protein